VLAGTRWGEAISAEFVVDQSKRWHLVRALPLFIHCNEQALSLVVNALKGERVPAGTVLAREGARMERFILIESGKIEVWRRSKETQDLELVGELHRGASLGDETFFGNGYYGATYRTVVATDILFLDVEACQRLVRSGVALATRVGALLQMVRLLAGMPLFNHLSPQQLSEVSRRLRRRTVTDQEVIAREGELRHSLFLVWSGEVEAFSRDSQGERSLAHVYTPGEHFGEYALFVDTPYRFTYRARGPGTLLLLDEATFDSLVAQSDRMAGYVEQIGSGRLLRMTRQADKS
jgi:CRP-like cAMP-binding protein